MGDLDKWIGDLIDEVIDELNGASGWTARQVAEKVIARAQENNPDHWYDWVLYRARASVIGAVGRRQASERARQVRNARKSVFADALDRAEAGDLEALDPYTTPYVVDTDGVQRQLGDMTGKECRSAAKQYRARARANRLQARFLEAVARRVGETRRVRDVIDPDQLQAMLRSIAGEEEETT